MIAFSWKPRLTKEPVDFKSEISQIKLEIIEHNLETKKTALSTKIVNIPITNIETTTLITDKPADGISKTQLK